MLYNELANDFKFKRQIQQEQKNKIKMPAASARHLQQVHFLLYPFTSNIRQLPVCQTSIGLANIRMANRRNDRKGNSFLCRIPNENGTRTLVESYLSVCNNAGIAT